MPNDVKSRECEVLNKVPMPIVVLDKDLSLVFVNDYFVKEVGYSSESLSNKGFVNYIFPKDVNIFLASIEYSEGEDFEVLFRFKVRNRGYVWMNCIVTYGRSCGADDSYILTLSYLYQEAEDNSTDYSKKLSALQEDNYYGSKIITDIEGKIIDFNNSFSEFIGYERSEVLGKFIFDLVIAEEGKDAYIKNINEVKSGAKEKRFPVTVKASETSVDVPTILHMCYFDLQGIEVVINVLDINTKEILAYEKSLEDKVNLLKLSERISGVGHWQIDIETQKMTWSEEVYRIHEVQADQYLPDIESSIEFFHPEDRVWVKQYFEDAVTKKEPFEFEHRIITSKGNVKYVYSKAYIRFDNKGKVDSIFGIIQDLTEIKESEIRLSNMVEELSVYNQELERFAYFASHDMQEPLRTINSFSDILKTKIEKYGGEDDDIIRYFDFIQQSSRQLQNLVKDLVDYSKSKESYNKKEEVDMMEVVNHVINSLSTMITSERAEVNVKGELPTLHASKAGLSRLVQNLIGNSLKYRRKEVSPIIEIYSAENKDFYIINIKDNGIGIDEKYKDHVFEPFKRLHSKFEYSGSGIGLAVCKKIVDGLGGDIYFKSNKDHGVTFTFTVPKD